MPEPNRARYRIETQLKGLRMWEIADARLELVVLCDACPNFKVWKPSELKRVFAKMRNTRIENVASQFRCHRRGSNWLRIGVAT